MSDLKRSALIAMSGGVDSSVAACLMKQRGYDCCGVTMRLFRDGPFSAESSKSCCSDEDEDDAEFVCSQIGIPFESVCYSKLFEEKVIKSFISEYEHGRTPNPCVECNRFLKFDALMEHAVSKGFDLLVTGHYAVIVKDEDTGRFLLKKAADRTKDQSYFLYMLTQSQLSRVVFPLGGLKKAQVRQIAESAGLVTSKKHESQDICFVPGGDYGEFLEKRRGSAYPSGAVVDVDGNIVGVHKGAVRYTIGQRKGLGIAVGRPVFVIGKDMEHNTVTVGDEPLLFHTTLIAEEMNWISIPAATESFRCKAKTRYRHKEQWATVYPAEGGSVRIVFDEPQRAITTGQAVVLYDDDTVIGGGTIWAVI